VYRVQLNDQSVQQDVWHNAKHVHLHTKPYSRTDILQLHEGFLLFAFKQAESKD
jgi:hypothetical protein